MADDADDVLIATVGELFANFHSALFAMMPIADRAKINYGDQEPHRDWERLAECLFDVFVRSPVESDRTWNGSCLPLARYDIDLDEYSQVSWIAIDSQSAPRTAVVRLLTRDEPFDMVQLVDIDPATFRVGQTRTVPLRDVRLVVVRRLENGDSEIIAQIEAIE